MSLRPFIKEIVSNYDAKRAIRSWLKSLKTPPASSGRVLVTALRNPTWIEWGVYCAAVVRLMGFESTILYKGSEARKFYPSLFFNFWKNAKLIPGIELIDLEELDYDSTIYQKYFDASLKPAIAALAYNFHIESEDILENDDIYGSQLLELRKESAINGARINSLLSKSKYHQFICYSGIIWDTPLLLRGALDADHDVVCVEGWAWRPGHMIYNFNAPALEYNVKGWMNYFGEWDDRKEIEIRKYFKFLDGESPDDDWLKNFYPVQLAKKSLNLPATITDFVEGHNKVFLLACNVIGDSSLLNRETIFRSHKDFIKQTVDYFKLHPDLKLIIRAHPAEEWVKSKVTVKLGEFSRSITQGINNILVIDSSEKVNTFSLLPVIDYGLVWLSSIGVDLVVRGIPVIAAAKPKYSELGIVEEPESISEFFAKIESFSKETVRSTPDKIQAAKEYLYVVFKGFSFEAQGRTYRADSCKMNKMPNQEEHDRFYRILLKLEPSPDRDVVGA